MPDTALSDDEHTRAEEGEEGRGEAQVQPRRRRAPLPPYLPPPRDVAFGGAAEAQQEEQEEEEEEEEDIDPDEEWTMDDLCPDSERSGQVPQTRGQLRRLIVKFHRHWVNDTNVDFRNLSEWFAKRFHMMETRTFDWQVMVHMQQIEYYKVQRLSYFLRVHEIQTPSWHCMFRDIDFAVHNALSFFLCSLRVMRVLRGDSRVIEAHDQMMKDIQALIDSNQERETQQDAMFATPALEATTMASHKGLKITEWQSAFIHLLQVLVTCNYRRADGDFFTRVVTNTGYETMAYKKEKSIEAFVGEFCSHHSDFVNWWRSTKEKGNHRYMIEVLTSRPLPEAPNLEEDKNLRSYEGDEVGRGAGIYDSAADFFYPYESRSQWDEMRNETNAIRRKLWRLKKAEVNDDGDEVHEDDRTGVTRDVWCQGAEAWWEALETGRMAMEEDEASVDESRDDPTRRRPSSLSSSEARSSYKSLKRGARKIEAFHTTSVCIKHLRNAFPYDIFGEVRDLGSKEFVYLSWREAEPYECRNVGMRLDLPLVAAALHRGIKAPTRNENGDVTHQPMEPEVWGRSWQVSPVDPRDLGWKEFQGHTALRHTLVHEHLNDITVEELQDGDTIHGRGYLRVWKDEEELCLVPLCTPARLPRMAFRPNEWLRLAGADYVGDEDDCKVDARNFVVHEEDGVKRYFVPDTGRTWRDCDMSEMDRIYTSQDFNLFDRFMLYALKGRLFFDVGERDNFEMTLMIEGIGGSGKSTIMRTVQHFWPPHRRGILSSNIQPEFGMSPVAEKDVIFCNEVSESLKIVQEEWQTSVSGEWGSYNVKNEKPLTCKWKGQHFWAGNQFPLIFNNLQGQVTRRMAGVLLNNPIKPRDSSIPKKIEAKLGFMQRKSILAYEAFLRMTKDTDPMSNPHTLPQAFHEYYHRSMRQTNTIIAFLSDSKYVQKVERGTWVPMEDVRKRFADFCVEYQKKGSDAKFDESRYRSAFAHLGIKATFQKNFDFRGVYYNDLTLVVEHIALVFPDTGGS